MPYYRECPNCGANLDPGESCDCQKQDNGEKEPLVTAAHPASYQQVRKHTFYPQKPQLVRQNVQF